MYLYCICVFKWLLELPTGAITSLEKPAMGIHSEDSTTSDRQTMRLGVLARLTDSTVGQGHINSPCKLSAVPGEKGLHSCFCKLHTQQSQHRFREADKLETDRGSDNKTKTQNDGCLWLQGLPLSTPCHLLGVVERRECVCVCACVPFLFWQFWLSYSPQKYPEMPKFVLLVINALVTPMTVRRTHLWCFLRKESGKVL